MENVFLTLQEATELSGKSEKALRMQILRGKLQATKIETGIKCGFEYRIPLQEMSERAQRKYLLAKRSLETPELDEVAGKERKPILDLEELTAEQRDVAWYWQEVLRQWQESLPLVRGKTEATEEFVKDWNRKNPERQLSARTLYDKQKSLKEYGVAGLADLRMSRDKRGHKVDEKLWAIFLQWYLDENRPAVSYVYKTLKRYAAMEKWDMAMASEATFRRLVREIPIAVIKYFRYGNKVYSDECEPYVERIYDDLTSNEYWTSDYHTLDLMVRDDITGEVYRPHLVVWTDIRSRKVLTLRLRRSSDSDGVQLAFRDAVRMYGIPYYVYLDNGREFLVHDFGGRGRRKTDKDAKYATGILDRLGIRMVNATVANGKAKVVERSFKQMTSEFSKLFITYCGNRPENRPERHADILKDTKNIPLASEVLRDLQDYIEGWYNQEPSQAKGLHGMSPNEAYAAHLIKKRIVTEDQVNLLLLRSTRLQTVCREGVFVTVGQEKLWFFEPEFTGQYMGTKVYVRYDPDHMRSVRVYDENEKFMSVLDRKLTGSYDLDVDTEAIKQNTAAKSKLKRMVKGLKENQKEIFLAPDMRDVVIAISRRNIERENIQYEATVLEMFPRQEEQEETMQAAVGGLPLVDLPKMARNAARRKGEDHV